MLKENIQYKILELVNEKDSIRAADLTTIFQTTHNDLDLLSQDL